VARPIRFTTSGLRCTFKLGPGPCRREGEAGSPSDAAGAPGLLVSLCKPVGRFRRMDTVERLANGVHRLTTAPDVRPGSRALCGGTAWHQFLRLRRRQTVVAAGGGGGYVAEALSLPLFCCKHSSDLQQRLEACFRRWEGTAGAPDVRRCGSLPARVACHARSANAETSRAHQRLAAHALL
jgi:hypothetical protein